jgi:hypothetical protein
MPSPAQPSPARRPRFHGKPGSCTVTMMPRSWGTTAAAAAVVRRGGWGRWQQRQPANRGVPGTHQPPPPTLALALALIFTSAGHVAPNVRRRRRRQAMAVGRHTTHLTRRTSSPPRQRVTSHKNDHASRQIIALTRVVSCPWLETHPQHNSLPYHRLIITSWNVQAHVSSTAKFTTIISLNRSEKRSLTIVSTCSEIALAL